MNRTETPTIVRRIAPVKTGFYGDRAYRATIVLSSGGHIRGFGRYKDVAIAESDRLLAWHLAHYYPEVQA